MGVSPVFWQRHFILLVTESSLPSERNKMKKYLLLLALATYVSAKAKPLIYNTLPLIYNKPPLHYYKVRTEGRECRNNEGSLVPCLHGELDPRHEDGPYGGSTAAGTNLEKICKYECDQSGGCAVKYTGPARLEETIVGHFPIFKYVYLMQNVSRPPVYQRPLA